jgi:hypothetical protein
MAEMPVAPRPATNTFTSYVPCTARHSTAAQHASELMQTSFRSLVSMAPQPSQTNVAYNPGHVGHTAVWVAPWEIFTSQPCDLEEEALTHPPNT